MSSIAGRVVAVCATWAVSLGVAAPVLAAPPGFDLLETDPQATKFSFRDEFTIPAGFFDPASAPFAGEVRFGGVPLETFQGHDVGDADTIVHRPEAANLVPPFPATATVPVEIVSLSLVSVEPITVQVGGAGQLWDVGVELSPTQPSQGQVALTKTSERGGTFSSQIIVLPKFTFTRLSDRTTRVLDVGQLHMPQESQQKLVLKATDVPWRAGCVPPALAVRGLNDDFCPGLTVEGEKTPFLEQALLADHGVLPAQPRLEHFKCYGAEPRKGFRHRTVRLVDDFGTERVSVLAPKELCTPVKKNSEPLLNRRAHLSCYAIQDVPGTPAFRQRTVRVRNQLGPAALTVRKPTRLCAPASKALARERRAPAKLRSSQLVDHFKCYTVKGDEAAVTVRLADQFDRERVRVLKPRSLCIPVQKGDERVLHPVRRLVCYAIRDVPARRRFTRRLVRVRDQFGVRLLAAQRPRTLCVPSVMSAAS